MKTKTNGHVWKLIVALCLIIVTGLVAWPGRFAPSSLVAAQTPDAWPGIALNLQASDLENPVHITHAGDGSGRLFVVEQAGRIRIIQNGALLATPFLDIIANVSCCGERGLLSVAFPPDYASKQYFYVNYTREPDGATVIARYRVTTNANVADPDSAEPVLIIDQPFGNHNGGQLAFGPDGYLYIGMGDGGGSGDPDERAQDPDDLLGKLLRIDVESGDTPYTIPPDNPYAQNPDFKGEIWALGLRNPWRFSFDRQTGDLYIADVGQGDYEEVNFQPSASTVGENYGWDIMEGRHCYPPSTTACDQTGLILPVFEYDHFQGDRSITGGYVYRGANYPALQGIYFFADYISGRIWGLRPNAGAWENGDTWEDSKELLDAPFLLSSFGEDQDGNLYLADYSNGRIYKVVDRNPDSVLDTFTYLPLVVQ